MKRILLMQTVHTNTMVFLFCQFIYAERLESPLRKQSGGLFLGRRVDEVLAVIQWHQARWKFSDCT